MAGIGKMILVTKSVLDNIFYGKPISARGRPNVLVRRPKGEPRPPKTQVEIDHRHKETPRSLEWIALYKSGQTLDQIGQAYGVTRERVRQILKLHGMTKEDGGQAIQALLKIPDRIERAKQHNEYQERRCLQSKGMTLDQWQVHEKQYGNVTVRGSPFYGYTHQRKHMIHHEHAKWNITFADWWRLWEESGKWSERGRGYGYCLSRFGGVGAFEVGNVRICRVAELASETYLTIPGAGRAVKSKRTHTIEAHAQIRWLHEQGWNQSRIAEIVGCSCPTVARVLKT